MSATPKQESFARKFVECGNASEAYIFAYKPKKMSANAIAVEACRLLKSPNVSLIVNQLKIKAMERHEVTIDSIAEELNEARMLAIKTENPSAAVSATMGKAKLYGLLIDKSEIAGKNGGPIAMANQELSDEELDARINDAIKQAGVAGLAAGKDAAKKRK